MCVPPPSYILYFQFLVHGNGNRAQDEPYLGALIAACLHQRGQRIRETALHLARQAAVLMIENLGAYSKSLDNQDVESLAAARVKNDRLDPLIYHALFDKVHKGIHPNLAKSKEEFKVAMRDSQLLMVSQICLAITMSSSYRWLNPVHMRTWLLLSKSEIP